MITPRGVQRGGEHELNFYGVRLGDAEEVFLYDEGIEVLSVEPVGEKGDRVKVRIRVDDDCRPGEHVAQVRTRSGISDFRSFYVGMMPTVEEAESNNNSIEQAQSIETNVTVAGTITNEDVDFYQVTAKKGERLSIEIEAMRLGAMFDPFISVVDSNRFELAASDDTPLLKQDGFISLLIPEDGDYFVMVREASYGGNDNSRYRIHIGNFPRPTAFYPAGGPAGTETTVQVLGDPAGMVNATIQVPPAGGFRSGILYSDSLGSTPSLMPYRISGLENVLEQEPNDEFEQAAAQHTRAEEPEGEESPAADDPHKLPRAFNGIIQSPGDQDLFSFHGKKDEVFEFDCFARRVGSGLDPVFQIYNSKQKYITGNDDAKRPDAYLRFKIPEDGQYFVRVADHLRRGQPDFVYRLEIAPVTPSLKIEIPRVDRYSQKRQAIVIPQGNRFATLVNATREDLGGRIKLLEDGLPPGVRMIAPPMPENLNSMPVVFEVDADAVIGGRLFEWKASKVDDSASGSFFNLADFSLGNPNNTRYYGCTVDQAAIAVVEKVPFRIEIVPPATPLVKNGSTNLKVKIIRDEGFAEKVTLHFPFRTPGVGTRSTVVVPGDKSEADYPLNANGKAQTGEFPVYVIGQSESGGTVWVSSQMATLKVAEPFVRAKIERTVLACGDSAPITCSFEHVASFEGEATLEVFGLPPGVTIPKQTFNKETAELEFTVSTTEETPVRLHKGIFCQLTIQHNGQPVVSKTGWMELQVKKPKVVKEEEKEEEKNDPESSGSTEQTPRPTGS